MSRERRRWTTTLAADVPTGPQGQPAHKAGATVAVVHLVALPEVGNVSMTVPRPSAIALDAAEKHVKRAMRLRKQLAGQTKRGRWIQNGHEVGFSNEELVYDFLEEASSAVILMHTALDNFANEQLPADFTFVMPGGQTVDRAQIEGHMSLPRRLDEVLPNVVGVVSIKSAEPASWDLLSTLKSLRDDLGHVHLEQTYSGANEDPSESVWSRLLAVDLEELMAAVEKAISHYG